MTVEPSTHPLMGSYVSKSRTGILIDRVPNSLGCHWIEHKYVCERLLVPLPRSASGKLLVISDVFPGLVMCWLRPESKSRAKSGLHMWPRRLLAWPGFWESPSRWPGPGLWSQKMLPNWDLPPAIFLVFLPFNFDFLTFFGHFLYYQASVLTHHWLNLNIIYRLDFWVSKNILFIKQYVMAVNQVPPNQSVVSDGQREICVAACVVACSEILQVHAGARKLVN